MVAAAAVVVVVAGDAAGDVAGDVAGDAVVDVIALVVVAGASETAACAIFSFVHTPPDVDIVLALAVANAEVQQLKKCLKDEQERSAAARRAVGLNRSAPIADVRDIFDEGHRMVQEKMKLKVRNRHEVDILVLCC